MSTIAITVCLLIIFLFHRVLLFRRKLKVVVILLVRGVSFIHYQAVNNLPGIRCTFPLLSLLNAIIGTNKWNPGLLWAWTWRASCKPCLLLHAIKDISTASQYIHPMARKRYPLCQYSALLQYLHLPLKLLGSLCRRTIRRSCSSPPFCLVKVHSGEYLLHEGGHRAHDY